MAVPTGVWASRCPRGGSAPSPLLQLVSRVLRREAAKACMLACVSIMTSPLPHRVVFAKKMKNKKKTKTYSKTDLLKQSIEKKRFTKKTKTHSKTKQVGGTRNRTTQKKNKNRLKKKSKKNQKINKKKIKTAAKCNKLGAKKRNTRKNTRKINNFASFCPFCCVLLIFCASCCSFDYFLVAFIFFDSF